MDKLEINLALSIATDGQFVMIGSANHTRGESIQVRVKVYDETRLTPSLMMTLEWFSRKVAKFSKRDCDVVVRCNNLLMETAPTMGDTLGAAFSSVKFEVEG